MPTFKIVTPMPSKKLLLASTSTLYQGDYLAYLKEPLSVYFEQIQELIFIPYARPSGISHVDYTAKAAGFFSQFNIKVRGIHTFMDPISAIENAEAVFTGGGNTFLLVKALYENNLMQALKSAIQNGCRYFGTSAGTNIAGITMQTTNDMPIVYPPSFHTLEMVPFNINPHYLDPVKNLRHNGETRETRILEFLVQNKIPVIGLREGSWLEANEDDITLHGIPCARIFEPGKDPFEVIPGSKLNFQK